MSATPSKTEPITIDVQLAYETLPQGNKGMVLRSKVKQKKKGAKGAKAVKGVKGAKGAKTGTPTVAGKGKKKKRGKKKRALDNIEVTTMTEDVLEDPEDLDQDYKALKAKVMAKFEEDGMASTVSKVTRSTRLEAKIEQILSTDCDTFYLVDLTTVILKYKYFKEYMPRVQPFYAVKCNPDRYLIRALVACGAGLDVASMPEMQKGLDAKQNPDNMIFANPCKMGEHIKFAAKNGVTKMTFDNAAELKKVAKFFPGAQMVLRILADDSHSTMRFGSKFGADVNEEVPPLLDLAYELGLAVIGVSFHVGSGCQSGEAYRNSLVLARKVFDIAEAKGHPMTFLDIGGGFLGTDTETVVFADVATSITASLEELFPSPDIRVIAEPGRYFASECVVLVTTVIARRERKHADTEGGGEDKTYIDYYISDGVYGSFNNMFFDYYRPAPHTMSKEPKEVTSSGASPDDTPSESPDGTPVPTEGAVSEHKSTLFGPTCDSIDVVCKDVELPDLEIGDHVYFFNMGAYTSAAASNFNGFNPPQPHYMIS